MKPKRLNICDYWGCREPVVEKNKEEKGMRFCDAHLRELNILIDKLDVKGILSFWVKASGGAEKMVHTPSGVYQSHELADTEESNGKIRE